jgi:hypothetical protein
MLSLQPLKLPVKTAISEHIRSHELISEFLNILICESKPYFLAPVPQGPWDVLALLLKRSFAHNEDSSEVRMGNHISDLISVN